MVSCLELSYYIERSHLNDFKRNFEVMGYLLELRAWRIVLFGLIFDTRSQGFMTDNFIRSRLETRAVMNPKRNSLRPKMTISDIEIENGFRKRWESTGKAIFVRLKLDNKACFFIVLFCRCVLDLEYRIIHQRAESFELFTLGSECRV